MLMGKMGRALKIIDSVSQREPAPGKHRTRPLEPAGPGVTLR